MTKTTVSSKGLIAIPKAVRERLNPKSGTEVSLDTLPDWHTMQGMVPGGESLTDARRQPKTAAQAFHVCGRSFV